jgi:maltose O-acetyltransferase
MQKVFNKFKIIAINVLACSIMISSKIRLAIYKLCGMKIGNGSFIYGGCLFNGTNIKIGNNSFVNYKCVFENHDYIEIGNNCSVGMEVMFCSATHEIGQSEQRAGRTLGFPIVVEDGCWIGSRAVILPGITIGKGCVIAAGALINKDCQPNGLYAGIPAKRIKELNELDKRTG